MQHGLFVGGGAVGPPLAPGVGVVAEFGAGDDAEGAVDPAARGGVERVVVEHVQELGDGGDALLFAEHAGLGEIAAGAFADARARIVREAIEKRIDGRVCAKQCQAFDGPVTGDFAAVVNVVQELRED